MFFIHPSSLIPHPFLIPPATAGGSDFLVSKSESV